MKAYYIRRLKLNKHQTLSELRVLDVWEKGVETAIKEKIGIDEIYDKEDLDHVKEFDPNTIYAYDLTVGELVGLIKKTMEEEK